VVRRDYVSAPPSSAPSGLLFLSIFFFAISGPFSSLFFLIRPDLNSVTDARGDGVVVRRPGVYGGSVCLLVFLGWLATGFASCCALTHLQGIICS